MADPELYNGDNEKLVAMHKDLGRVANGLARAEERWLELQEQFEFVRSPGPG